MGQDRAVTIVTAPRAGGQQDAFVPAEPEAGCAGGFAAGPVFRPGRATT